MACLIYLCVVAMEYESSQAAPSEFIDGLQKEVFKRVERHYVCSEELLYLLFWGIEHPEVQTPDLSWQVYGLISTAKKLSGSHGNGFTSIYCYFWAPQMMLKVFILRCCGGTMMR